MGVRLKPSVCSKNWVFFNLFIYLKNYLSNWQQTNVSHTLSWTLNSCQIPAYRCWARRLSAPRITDELIFNCRIPFQAASCEMKYTLIK